MIELQLEVDSIKKMQKKLKNFDNKVPSAIANTINRMTKNIRKTMAKETVKSYNVTSEVVKKTIDYDKAAPTKLKAVTLSKASPIALAKFKVSPKRTVFYSRGKPSPKVYKVSVKKGAATKPLNALPKAFLAVITNLSSDGTVSEHRGLFRREPGAKRYPIKQLFGPSVPQMIKNEESIAHIEEEAKSTLQKRMDVEIKNILRKR